MKGLRNRPRNTQSEGPRLTVPALAGRLRSRPKPRPRSTPSWRPGRSSTRRRHNAWPSTATPCSPSTASLPSTGSTCAPPNPIESTFATVRHRTHPAEGLPLQQDRARHGVGAGRGRAGSWRRLDGHPLLPKLILGVKFADGLEVVPKNTALSPTSPPPDRSGRHPDSAIAPSGPTVCGVDHAGSRDTSFCSLGFPARADARCKICPSSS
jgi:hypothetical protein